MCWHVMCADAMHMRAGVVRETHVCELRLCQTLCLRRCVCCSEGFHGVATEEPVPVLANGFMARIM